MLPWLYPLGKSRLVRFEAINLSILDGKTSTMKINFLVPATKNLFGGIRVIGIYAGGLKCRGHDVKIILYPASYQTFPKKLKGLLKGKGWPKHSDSKVCLSYFENLGVSCHWVPGAITNKDCPDADVSIATWWETAPWVAKLSPSKGAKTYFMQDYGAPGQEFDQIIPTWRLPLHIITIAQWLVDLIHTHCGDIPVSLVPNAVDFEQFSSEPRDKQATPTLGTMYRPMYTKGLDLVQNALEIARQDIPELKLLMFGYDPLDANFAQLPQVIYTQNASDDEISYIYRSCDAWLFPSRLEGFGLPILEAMACRTPVIGTPAGAAPELLADGGGILVKPEDPQDMAQAILKICHLSEDKWKIMSDQAYAKATGYTWEDAITLFEQALYQAMNNEQ